MDVFIVLLLSLGSLLIDHLFRLLPFGSHRRFLPSDRSARLTSTTTTAPAVPFPFIQNFCQNLNSEAARRAPERGKSLALRPPDVCASHSDVLSPSRPVTMLAKGIAQRAEAPGPVRRSSIIPVRTASFT